MRLRVTLAALTVLALVAGVGAYLLARDLRPRLPALLGGQACEVRTDQGTVAMNIEQMANAATVAAVGIRRKLPERAVVVALATALQESKLENLPHGDRDSLGLFQQRPSQGWGTEAQLQNPRYAAGKFYSALVKVKGWEKLSVTVAAQRVQRSAYPDAYQQWADEAAVLTEALNGSSGAAVSCTVTGEPASRGATAVNLLGKGLRQDWGKLTTIASSDATSLALTAGSEQIGWQFAHWLVAHATAQGVERVRFGSRQWSARDGRWTTTDPQGPAAGERVVAEVYGAV